MAKQKIEVELDVPEGFECTGEFRAVRTGEYYYDSQLLMPVLADRSFGLARLIFRKKPKRYIVLEVVDKRIPLAGEQFLDEHEKIRFTKYNESDFLREILRDVTSEVDVVEKGRED